MSQSIARKTLQTLISTRGNIFVWDEPSEWSLMEGDTKFKCNHIDTTEEEIEVDVMRNGERDGELQTITVCNDCDEDLTDEAHYDED